MKIAPFIKSVRQSGGTLYIFSSATEDLNYLINRAENRSFVWSKFVLLDIPDEGRPTSLMENLVQYDAIPAAFGQMDNKTPENRLAESFQNYCLNLETLLTGLDSYSIDEKRTVSERVFFKWLKEIGAIRFKQASSTEKSGLVGSARFTEDDATGYSRVVQYIGDIDMVNATKFNQNSYSELYIHVPLSHGNTSTVLFNTIEDANYKQNMAIQNIGAEALDVKYIAGRKADDKHPVGLDFTAHYDSPTDGFSTATYDLYKEVTTNNVKRFVSGWWYDLPISNSYRLSSDFADQHNVKLKIAGKNALAGKNVTLIRSNLDGISIDFDENSYYDIVTNPSISSFSEYNQASASQPFKFNAVLLYYDVFNDADPTDKATNLFGVLFLNKPVAKSAGGSYMPRLSKYKPNPVTGDNGNAWGLKVNMKLDVNTSDAQIESIVNEYNTFSMELFMEALSELTRTSDSIANINSSIATLKDEVATLYDYVYRTQDFTGIKEKVDSLYKLYNENLNIFSSVGDLSKLIEKAFQEINNIYNNKTSIDVTYNLDVLDAGFGIKLNSINNKKKIAFGLQQYLVDANKPIISIAEDFSNVNNKHTYEILNDKYTQYFLIQEDGFTSYISKYFINKDIEIYIDDTINPWYNGKTFRFSFGTIYDTVNGFEINFYTDKNDKMNNGKPYGVHVNKLARIPSEIFKIKPIGGTVEEYIPPTIEIVCIDKDNMVFSIDIF